MKLSNQALLWLNTATFAVMIFANMAGGLGWFGATVGDVSDQYSTLLTPAGYAFSIWSLIYLLLLVFVGYQWRSHQQGRDQDSLAPSDIWFAASNVCNTLWIVVWLNGYIAFSFLIMMALFACLAQLVLRLRLETWDAPVRIIFFVWWPICIYIGWITLAMPVNFASIFPSLFASPTWAILAIAAITSAYLVWIAARNMREAAMVGIWGLIAVVVNQWSVSAAVSWFALACCALLAMVVVQHALRNRETWPNRKLARGEF